MNDKIAVLAIAIDDAFAAPALVMLRSACRHLSPGWRIDVFVLGHRVSQASKEMLTRGLEGLPVHLHWRTPDLGNARGRLPGVHKDGDVTVYFRLLIGEQLPKSVERVIFVDVDILVEGNLVELWNLPFDGAILQAVPDAYASTLHLPRLRRLARFKGVPCDDVTRYFNAGVLVVDLRAWRAKKVQQRALDLLAEHKEDLWWRDQDALNCILAGRWRPLPPAWNLHELPHCLFLWEGGAASAAELRQAFQAPKIVHFIGHWKPWGRTCTQKYCRRWRQVAREAGVYEEPPPS
ncbi:MAG: glycosyltransferase family 8 protein, partial [Anaerolineae bacterium]